MKASMITALTWAACTIATPVGLGLRDVAGGQCTCEVETVTITVPAPTEVGPIGGPTVTGPVETGPAGSNPTETEPAETEPAETEPAETEPAETEPAETGPGATGPGATGPGATGPDDKCHGTGHLIQDLGPQVGRALYVTGADGEKFLVQVNEDVYNLLSGRVSLSDSIGEIVGDAATLGDLIADLGPIIDCILTIVGEDAHILLVRLAPEIADLLRGAGITLGLDAINNPIGGLLGGLTGGLLTRDVQRYTVQGQSGPLPVALDGRPDQVLRENHYSGLIGSVIDIAISVTELLQHPLAQDSEDLIIIIGRDTGALLIKLAPGVAQLLHGLLPELATPVGRIVYIVGDSL
ncbi:uncharacterized protein DSM5745_07445 [Aspergillus mulundensis]|uniref:Uncharacterized protein n=1 Tax=Aspergillus mulundensis TaxID=1810919 RepID=A0A3D8RDX7_9EURO|nr:Uncharacterized protein DSM5745_07445 [Aspergillus mulundensis]RDW72273.1 Uncharacterized protein DSM5745_07445 [Aspergillus mulundensis]